MKTVKLTKGFEAIVDDEDFDRVSMYKWHVSIPNPGRTPYAARKISLKEDPRGRHQYLHVFIAGFKGVDHKDGNGLNCVRSNLRKASKTQNNANRAIQKHSSKYKGVSFCKSVNRWRAFIRISKKQIPLGQFKNEEDAAIAYDQAATKHYGEFARTNQQMGAL